MTQHDDFEEKVLGVLNKDSVVFVIDAQKFIQEKNSEKYEEIVILKFGGKGRYIGILVNSLSDIPEIQIEDIRPLDEYRKLQGSNFK